MRNVIKFLFPLLTLMAAEVAEAKGVGMVLDVRGAVSVNAGSKSRSLEITDALDADTHITVGNDGEVSFIFYTTREQYTVIGPAVLRLESQSVKTVQGSSPRVKKLPMEKAQVAQGYLGRVVPAALVMRGKQGRKTPLHTIYPADGEFVLEAHPEFAWSASAGTVSMVLLEGDNKLFESIVDGTHLLLPTEITLLSGRHYRWLIQADGRAAIAAFTIATDEQQLELAALKPADLSSPADWAIYAMALEQAKAFGEARHAWAQIAASRPDSDTVKNLAR